MNHAHRELRQKQAECDGTGPRPAFGLATELGAKPRRQLMFISGTWADEVRYHRSMAKLMRERGFEGLALSHEFIAGDDPLACDCEACWRRREELAWIERGKERKP